MGRRRYVPITAKVNLIIVAALIAGIGAVSFFFVTRITNTVEGSIRDNFDQQTEILFSAIENFMLPGEAELAVSFFDQIGQTTERYTIRLFRTTGQLAFSDHATLEDVLTRRPALRPRFETVSPRIQTDPTLVWTFFSRATSSPPEPVFFRAEQEGAVFARAYQPLINLPDCTYCHGADHTIRGVIDIRTDITETIAGQRESVALTGAFYAGLVTLLTLVLSLYMRRSIIRPVKTIGSVCERVTQGDFGHQVTVKNKDEIGQLGKTVNTMVEGLHERFELAKYVSSSTLKSLRGSAEGRSVPLTMLFSDIRGFTSYSERRSPEEVVATLNRILNAQTEIIQQMNGDVDKYVGDEIVAIFAEGSHAADAVRAALMIQERVKSTAAERHGLSVGIGINTGQVILGMIGSERRADFTVIGDNVNTAARLCDAAEPGQVIVTESAFEQVRDIAVYTGPYRLKAKGKEQYVRVYQITGIIDAPDEGAPGEPGRNTADA